MIAVLLTPHAQTASWSMICINMCFQRPQTIYNVHKYNALLGTRIGPFFQQLNIEHINDKQLEKTLAKGNVLAANLFFFQNRF